MPMSYLFRFCFDGQNIRKACRVKYLHDSLTNMTEYKLTRMGLLHDEQNPKACRGDVCCCLKIDIVAIFTSSDCLSLVLLFLMHP